MTVVRAKNAKIKIGDGPWKDVGDLQVHLPFVPIAPFAIDLETGQVEDMKVPNWTDLEVVHVIGRADCPAEEGEEFDVITLGDKRTGNFQVRRLKAGAVVDEGDEIVMLPDSSTVGYPASAHEYKRSVLGNVGIVLCVCCGIEIGDGEELAALVDDTELLRQCECGQISAIKVVEG